MGAQAYEHGVAVWSSVSIITTESSVALPFSGKKFGISVAAKNTSLSASAEPSSVGVNVLTNP